MCVGVRGDTVPLCICCGDGAAPGPRASLSLQRSAVVAALAFVGLMGAHPDVSSVNGGYLCASAAYAESVLLGLALRHPLHHERVEPTFR